MLDKITVQVHGEQRPFWFRRGTSDQYVIEDTFGENPAFDLSGFARHDEIMAFYVEARDGGRLPLVVDAGANIGAASIYFVGKWKDVRVVALEPQRENADLCRMNCEGLPVQVMEWALGPQRGYVDVVDPGEGHWGYRTRQSAEGVTCVSVGDLYRQWTDCTPFIVKIDIEGGEREVFREISWIEKTPILIVEPHDWMLPKSGTCEPLLWALGQFPDRDFIIHREHVVSIAHDLRCQR